MFRSGEGLGRSRVWRRWVGKEIRLGMGGVVWVGDRGREGMGKKGIERGWEGWGRNGKEVEVVVGGGRREVERAWEGENRGG